ncbi:protein NDH-DEPENDENT CYCLIC ELECTRON FLOW 5-like [Lolium rigidum]|uniref:protein NDH-DEPENDENT CYCLIC ELECTRON FLOW 5-like n=1 Tax=Lolium rigidum TaxID=89674 RepID=UPI001F5DCC11|nr:protein NDH-DEPENDENT CYCLIC ELECTRON FLOW 5-like [Lolium rigidum]
MAFGAPTAAAPHGHATVAPPTSSSWKHGTTFFSSSKLSGGISGQRARLVTAVHALAPATSVPAPFPPPNAEYLAAEFSGHGVTFEAVGDSCVVKMLVRNGSAAHLLLPSGLVTSYKPAMWHGASMEVLHTTVGEGPGGMPVIRGGVSVDLRCARGVSGDAPPSTWSPGGAWSLRDVRGGPTGSIQVELVSVEPPGNGAAEARCVVTLSPDALASELTVTNAASSSSAVALSGAVSNHLRVSTPDATYAVGLQGSDYRSREPILSEFSILLPDSARLQQPHWAKRVDMFLSGEGAAAVAQEPDGEEDDDFKHLTAEMCRIYSHAPRDFTVIDRGRRNSVCLSRRGFEELYVFSPGSKHEWYGKYAYVCVGPAMLKPVVLAPGATWQGAQCIRNPNL